MAAVLAVQLLTPVTAMEQLPTTMTSMAEVQVHQRHDLTTVVVLQRHSMTSTEEASAQVRVGKKGINIKQINKT